MLRNVYISDKRERKHTISSVVRKLEVIAAVSDEAKLCALEPEMILVHAFGSGYRGMPRARNLALT